jgi:hypothetical protein
MLSSNAIHYGARIPPGQLKPESSVDRPAANPVRDMAGANSGGIFLMDSCHPLN